MTDFTAYDAGLPCKNPNCKSHGVPHPNCKCYSQGSMYAKGGFVSACAGNMKHETGCEYYADGGEVSESAPDFIPDEVFSQQQEEARAPQAMGVSEPDSAPDFIPDSEFKSLNSEASTDVAPDFISDSDLKSATGKYNTTGQEVLAGIEGLAQGVAGPLATLAEQGLSKLGVPGLTDEDIVGRQEASPWIHGISEAVGLTGSMLIPGVGVAGVATKAAKAAQSAAEVSRLGKVGGSLIHGFVQSGVIQGSDEISKAMLGQGDPETPVASALVNIGAAGLLGVGGQILGGAASKTLDTIGTSKASSWLAGFGASGMGKAGSADLKFADMAKTAKQLKDVGGFDPKAFLAGAEAFDKHKEQAARFISSAIGAKLGGISGGIAGYAAGPIIEKGLETSGIIPAAGKYAVAPVVKWLSTGAGGDIARGIRYAKQANNGYNLINTTIDGLFTVVPQQALDTELRDRNKYKLKKFIEDGGINQQIQDITVPQYAEGGEVQSPLLPEDDAIATHFPEQNMLLSMAKGRISNYLSSQQPATITPHLAFDDTPPDHEAESRYNDVLELANDPLSVIRHIGTGTLLPEHMQHMQAMYPEVITLMQKQMTDRITRAQLAGEKPPFHVIQGMSLFLGANLDGSLTPESMQAAQSVFAGQKQQQAQQNPVKNKRGTSSLSDVSENYLTGDQARQKRQSNV
jgi:hypothetical protein